MANAEHLKILKEGVEVWNRWREKDAVQPNLSGAYIPEIDLTNANLTDANLSGAEMANAILAGSYLNRADLNRTNLACAYLLYANLNAARLTYANLSNTDFNGAELERSEMIYSNLMAANLSNAKLKGADLRGANLRDANLTDTDFSNADLRDVNLSYANLTNTIFNDTRIGGTTFGMADLSTCIGLGSIKVIAPCTIDFQTLRASKNLPKSFLLKLGLPELYVDYLPDFYHNEGIRFYPAFLSHSWANKPFARKLYEAMIAKGVNVFFDEKKMKPGDDIFTSISRGIDLYDKTILVCSEDSLNSWWVDQELELVFEKERALQKEAGEKIGLLIPIRIDDYLDTWSSGKRMAIKQRMVGDFRGWEDERVFERALGELIHALNADRPEIKPVSHLPRKPKP